MKTLVIILSVIFINPLSATIIKIPIDQPPIQIGLNVASKGDTLLVAEGTYYENIIWSLTNGIKLICVSKENCIIDGFNNRPVINYENCDIVHDSTNVIKKFYNTKWILGKRYRNTSNISESIYIGKFH